MKHIDEYAFGTDGFDDRPAGLWFADELEPIETPYWELE